jgi:hypothetical protein
MGGTQLTQLASNVRVIDIATTPFLSADECRDVIDSCAPDAWYAGTRRDGTRHEVSSCLDHLQLEGIVR